DVLLLFSKHVRCFDQFHFSLFLSSIPLSLSIPYPRQLNAGVSPFKVAITTGISPIRQFFYYTGVIRMKKMIIPFAFLLFLGACGNEDPEPADGAQTEVAAPEGELDPTAPE